MACPAPGQQDQRLDSPGMAQVASSLLYRRMQRVRLLLVGGMALLVGAVAAILGRVAHGPEVAVGLAAMAFAFGGLLLGTRPRRVEPSSCEGGCGSCSSEGGCEARFATTLAERIAAYDAARFRVIADRAWGIVALPLVAAILGVLLGGLVAAILGVLAAVLLVAGLLGARRLAPQ